jgi:hypothetical protein
VGKSRRTPSAASSFPEMSWDVDDIRITRVVEHVVPFGVDFFADATPAEVAAEAWLVPDYVDADGHYLMSFHTFVVEARTLRFVVDTCIGNWKPRPLIPEFDHQDRPFLCRPLRSGSPLTRSTSSSAPLTCRSRGVEYALASARGPVREIDGHPTTAALGRLLPE